MAKARKVKCPGCGLRIYHLAGDRFRTCHRCGWTAGWPVLRWLTHPTWLLFYFRRIRYSPIGRLIPTVKLVLLVALAATVVAAGVPFINTAAGFVSESTGVDVPKIDITTDTSLNVSRAERLTFEETNAQRRNHSVRPVEFSPELSLIARKHSQDMARHDYIGHTEPDGDTVSDRLSQHPNPCPGYTNSKFLHGENAGGTHWRKQTSFYGSEETVRVTHESDVARALVTAWMNSEGHRRNMLYGGWEMVGIGIAINESTDQVYVTQLFC